MPLPSLKNLVRQALFEDMPEGDLTSDALKNYSKTVKARLLAKEDLVLSGSCFFNEAFTQMNQDISIHWFFEDGSLALKDQVVARLEGPAGDLLKAERVALNFLGFLSGIASYTKCFVDEMQGSTLLDTRKTLPLYREWIKQAVQDGGASNHRMNLSSAIMIKENHIKLAGSLQQAIEQVKQSSQGPIEVEVTNVEELQQAIELKVDRVLLDNMNAESVRRALELLPRSIESEVSGGVDLENIREISQLGADYISVGAITHSAPQADFSLLFE